MSCRHALPALLGLILLASGCAGGFSRHYQAADDHVRPVDTLESCSAPRVEQLPASVMEKRLAAALADGYVRLGRATWESAVPASTDDAAAQAGRVGACLVLQSVTPIPQQPEKPHYQAHPGFVSRIGQRASLPRTTAATWAARPRSLRCVTAMTPSSLPARGREATLFPAGERRQARTGSPGSSCRPPGQAPAGQDRSACRPGLMHTRIPPHGACLWFRASGLNRRIHTKRGSLPCGTAPSFPVRGYRYSLARC